MTPEQEIIQHIEVLSEHTGLSISYLSKLILNGGGEFKRLKNGGELRRKTIDNARHRINDVRHKNRMNLISPGMPIRNTGKQ